MRRRQESNACGTRPGRVPLRIARAVSRGRFVPLEGVPGNKAARLVPHPAWLLLAGLIAVLAGCQEDAGPLPPNQTPTTFLQIQGTDLDTVQYRQILRWWGADPDGEVIGYCIRWTGEWTPPSDAERCDFDTTFSFTQATTDTFVVPIGGSFGERSFTVHAVDNEGVIDPVGKTQIFRLANWVPDLAWSEALSRPTLSLPAVTFGWSPTDLDGRTTVTSYRYWLDGQDPLTEYTATADTIISLEVDDFESRYGDRTIFVQAYDEALAPSDTIRHTWLVEAPPTERYLLIDNAGTSSPGNETEDGFYRAILDSVAPGDYFVYDMEVRGDFRSDREIFPLFSIFEGVVWYGGNRSEDDDASARSNLAKAESGLERYLSAGGNVLLAHREAIGNGALSDEFADEILGVDELYRDASGSHQLRLLTRSRLSTSLLPPPSDTLGVGNSTPDADFAKLAVDDELQPTFWVVPGFLDSTFTPDQSAEPAYLGWISERLDGRLGLNTFLLSRSDLRGNAHEAGAELLRRIFED